MIKRPIVRYHGGKWKLAKWIISNFPTHRIYTESFGGAGSVLLQKRRCYAEVYNDLDGEMVNLFRVARDSGDELGRLLDMTPYSRDEYKLSFELSDTPLEQARRTVIRSFMGFGSNALCRNIQSGFRSCLNRSGTTPAHDWSNYSTSLKAIIHRLRGVVIENKTAAEIMAQHDGPQTLHYCDPPYVHATRSARMHGHHGYTHEMTDTQHRELATFLGTLKGMIVLSGYNSPLYDELYWRWDKASCKALADGAKDRVECLWFKNINADLFGEHTQ